MNDLISRQAAIDALGCEIIVTGRINAKTIYAKAIHDYINLVCDRIKGLPSAQQWIPCTPETMPEREGRYVCTYTYDGKKDVFMFRYEDGQFMVPWYVDAITAWYKPLDPWEGGQDNG